MAHAISLEVQEISCVNKMVGLLTKPSSGMSPNVSCFGLRLMVLRGAGIPEDDKQLISVSFALFYSQKMEDTKGLENGSNLKLSCDGD